MMDLPRGSAPATAIILCLLTFVICFFRVGKRNFAGLCIITTRKEPRLALFDFLPLFYANPYAVGFAIRRKLTSNYVSVSSRPEKNGNWSSSPLNESEFSPRSIQSCFTRFSRGASCRQSPSLTQHFVYLTGSNTIAIVYEVSYWKSVFFRSDRGMQIVFDPIGSKTDWRLIPFFSIRWTIAVVLDPVGSKSADGDFLQQGPWRSGQQLWIDLRESSLSFWCKQTNFYANAHAYALKGNFPRTAIQLHKNRL